jgi:DNA polymerase beta
LLIPIPYTHPYSTPLPPLFPPPPPLPQVTYSKVISILSTYPIKITSIEQLRQKDGKFPRFFGDKTVAKLNEILRTGRLEKLDRLLREPKTTLIREFARIWGVGGKTAERLMQLGYKSIADLRKVRCVM